MSKLRDATTINMLQVLQGINCAIKNREADISTELRQESKP